MLTGLNNGFAAGVEPLIYGMLHEVQGDVGLRMVSICVRGCLFASWMVRCASWCAAFTALLLAIPDLASAYSLLSSCPVPCFPLICQRRLPL